MHKKVVCFIVSFAAAESMIAGETLAITARVYNYAQVDEGTMNRAQRIAGQAFRHAGIEITWVGCPTTEKERPRFPACRAADDSRPLVLRIRPNAPDRFSNQKHVFGVAYLGAPGSIATIADIYLDRVENATLEKLYSGLDRVIASPLPSSFRPGVTLGVVLAHEIGHILLGSNSHTRRGIMKPSWDRQDLEDAYLGRQLFSISQMKRLRSGVMARTP